MRLPRRFLAITAGLVATGAVVGALAAVVALSIGLLATGGPRAVRDPWTQLFAASVGAVYGAVGAPLFGWLVLRYVPLGRAIAWTAAGTVIGGAAAWMLPAYANPLFTAPLGFAAASLLVRSYSRAKDARKHNKTPDAV